jgi:hydrogenase expression/formation protein HypE
MADRRALVEALARIEQARSRRRGRPYLRDERVTLSHGSGGKATHNLIEGLFAPAFANPILDLLDDAAVCRLDGTGARLAFTTDSYVVSPLFFPGGDIGALAVHGTVNDLAMAGATPLFLSAAFILEEGFLIADLRRIVQSMRQAAETAGVVIVTGDTKVVERGKADGLYVSTAGVGMVRPATAVSAANARPGDRVLVSGRIAEHGTAIMLARDDLAIETDVASDTAPLNGLVAALLDRLGVDVHCLKDPTRGGVATACNEIARQSGVAIALDEGRVPVRPDVRGACELLGIDALHIANEGKLIAVVAPGRAGEALEIMREHPLGEHAAVVGEVLDEPEGMVFVRTEIGGRRVLDMLVGDALPRIC